MHTIDIDFLKRRIKKNQKFFLKLEKAIQQEKDLRKQAEMAYEAATFAMQHTTDIFSSPILESVFLKIAQTHQAQLSCSYHPNTLLHVMTEAYTSGGHTRCVERWISQFPEQKHSCVILNQKADFPNKLKDIIETQSGTLRLYDITKSMLTRALELRTYASQFEYVILHIHMNDPMSLMAFGTEDFQRPIIFFNHADHAFWLGVSISDYVADLNTNRNLLSLEKRGVKNAFVLGIPLDNNSLATLEKCKAREKLGIPKGKKVIFSSGQASKYSPIGKTSFYNIVSDMVMEDPNILFYIAGAKADQLFWPKLKKEFPNNLILTGILNYATEYPLYLSAADLVLDSYPVGGATAMIDAVKAGKPVLTLNRNIQADYLINSRSCCHTYQELLEKTHYILNDTHFKEDMFQEVYHQFKLETDPTIWHNKCKRIFSQLPKKHKIYTFKRPKPDDEVTPFSLETCCWTEPVISKFKQIRKFLWQIRWTKNEKIIRILGIMFLYKKYNNVI